MGPDTGRVSIPSWKLELIKNRRNSKTSASFSHYDRAIRPERFQSSNSSIPEDSPARPSDLIKFFNKTTDVARRNLSSSRSFSAPRRGAEMFGTTGGGGGGEPAVPAVPALPGAGREGMSGGPGRAWQQQQAGLLSCERTDGTVGSVIVAVSGNRSHLTQHSAQTTPPSSTYSLADCPTREEDETEESLLSDLTWPDTASSVESDQADRYSEQGELEILFGQSMQMGEDTRLFISNAGARQDADRQARLSSGVGARLYRGRQGNKKNSGLGLNGNGSGDSDGMMGSGGESDSSEEIHYGPGFVSRWDLTSDLVADISLFELS